MAEEVPQVTLGTSVGQVGAPEDDPKSTRELILDEALRCFAAAGFDGTSLNDIAAGVGIRRPSLLHHFDSKDALYEEVFERLLGDWLARLEIVSANDSVGWSKVEEVIRAGLTLFENTPDYVRIMRREALDGGAHLGIDLAGVMRPLFDAAVQYFEREMDAGVFRRHDPRHLLITGYGAVLSYFSDAPFIDGLIDEPALTKERIDEHAEHIVEFFRSALVPSLSD